MQVPVQITYRNMASSAALDEAVRDRVAKLEQFYARPISCRVVIEQPARHQRRGKEFVVHVELTVPGSEIAVNRGHHEDVYVALRDTFDAARRRLEDFARTQRGD